VDLLWSLLAIVLLVVYFLLLFRAVLDVFRRPDLGGWAKAGWFGTLLVVPVVPLLVYLVLRGAGLGGGAPAEDQQVPDAGTVSS
jgi:hypothetical protein